MLKTVKKTLLLLAVAFIGACQVSNSASAGKQRQQKLVITGSSTVAPLVLEMGRRYESKYPGTRIDVQTGGSSRGIRDAHKGLADIGMVSRALKPEEGHLKGFVIAQDGIGLIVHQDNPVKQLSRREVIDIYTGKITNWKAVNGFDGPITVVSKADGRSTLELFLSYYGLESTQIRAQIVIGDNEQGIKTVAGNRGALGYVSIGTAEYDIEQGIGIRLLAVEGIAATRQNVANLSFPLSRQLNLVTAEEPSELSRSFINFAQSQEVYDLIEEMYFVPAPK